MTNKEAIKWLESIAKKYIHGGDEWYDEQRHEAINLAIIALGKSNNEFVDKLMKEFDEIAEKSATGQMTAIPIAHIKEIIKRVVSEQEGER